VDADGGLDGVVALAQPRGVHVVPALADEDETVDLAPAVGDAVRRERVRELVGHRDGASTAAFRRAGHSAGAAALDVQ
jgi:hypothetical protein